MTSKPDTDLPALEHKVILITGGTDGLGKEAVRQLSLSSPACIYLAARNRTKAEKVLDELQDQYPNHAPVKFIQMDLSDLASIKAAAAQFKAENKRLDILMCNAGVYSGSDLTNDGYEATFGINAIGHALLIQLLLPTLRETANQPASDVRVVVLSSVVEWVAPKRYTYDNMKSNLSEITGMTRYAQSKLANIHYTAVLAQRYPQIMSVSVHPGVVATQFQDAYKASKLSMTEWIMGKIAGLFITPQPAAEGVKAQLWCATTERSALQNGAYYWPVGVPATASSRSKDMKAAEELYEWINQELKDYL